METLQVDEDLYAYIVSKTKFIGEDASSILRRELGIGSSEVRAVSDPATDRGETSVESGYGNWEFLDSLGASGVFGARHSTSRFLLTLGEVYKRDPEAFEGVLQCRGRTRVYFARSAKEITDASPSGDPRRIPGSEYYVTCNASTEQKARMLMKALVTLGCNRIVADRAAQ